MKSLRSVETQFYAIFLIAFLWIRLEATQTPPRGSGGDIWEVWQKAVQSYESKNYAQSLELFMDVLLEEPGYAETREYMARVGDLLLKQELERMAGERKAILKEAAATYQEQTASQRRTQEELEKAARALQEENLLAAYQTYRQVLESRPENAQAQRGIELLQDLIATRLKTGDFKNPRERTALLGFYHFTSANYREAIGSWEKSLELRGYPLSVPLQVLEEYLTRAADELKKQIEALKPSIPTGPSPQELQRQAKLKRSQEFHQRGKYFWEKGDYRKALAYIEQALREYPPNQGAQKDLAKVRAERKHMEPKLQAKAEEYYKRGLVFYGSGNLEGAILIWEMAVRLDPYNEKAKKSLDRAKEELKGKHETASVSFPVPSR